MNVKLKILGKKDEDVTVAPVKLDKPVQVERGEIFGFAAAPRVNDVLAAAKNPTLPQNPTIVIYRQDREIKLGWMWRFAKVRDGDMVVISPSTGNG